MMRSLERQGRLAAQPDEEEEEAARHGSAQPAPALLHPPAVRICRTCKATGGGGWGGTTGLRRLDTGGDPRPEAFSPPPLLTVCETLYTPLPQTYYVGVCVCVCGGKNHKLWLLWQQAVKP